MANPVSQTPERRKVPTMVRRWRQRTPLHWHWDRGERLLAHAGLAALAVVVLLIAIER